MRYFCLGRWGKISFHMMPTLIHENGGSVLDLWRCIFWRNYCVISVGGWCKRLCHDIVMLKCEEVFKGVRTVGLHVKWSRSTSTVKIRYGVRFQWTLHWPVAFRFGNEFSETQLQFINVVASFILGVYVFACAGVWCENGRIRLCHFHYALLSIFISLLQW